LLIGVNVLFSIEADTNCICFFTMIRNVNMGIEHHDLVHELPEYRDQIHALKMTDAHFLKLFDEYHEVTKEVELMEAEVKPGSSKMEEELKLRRLRLKDKLYAMLSEKA